ncbi:PorP/SprF family type IX secretion system membrane protein [Spirosoma validum]|uniref:PorP/SprF family type IX secretion system membrane protein n=1 Tax=Spirosoma validum TaxID=2771355 RepID=A0A927B0Q4_9BACT|nr:PorP/SprF family type IX secretion system membrane protein [Spirosoma validum]MBD2753283.1 PorP/SprF family type IX secretion system membrane protein [Spirosoma validum]
MRKSIVTMLLGWLWANPMFAQDPQFSQFYANPLYHNPAFAGSSGSSRLILNYRNQWPALGTNYQTMTASFDTYLAADRGPVGLGWGIQAMHDQQASFWRTNRVTAMMAPDVTLFHDSNRSWRLILAPQVSFTSGQYNPVGLTFVDQFSANGLTSLTSADPLSVAGINHNYWDLSLGTLLESQPDDRDQASFWVGGTMHHIGKSVRRDDWVTQRWGAQFGIRFPMGWSIGEHGLGHEASRDKSVTLTANYRQQGADRQLDAGLNATYSPVMVGVWYRNIPFRRYNQTTQRDALIGLVALQLDRFMVQYSYDITISSLSWASGGAHELTVWYGFDSLFSFSSRRGNAKRQRKCLNF